MSLRFRQIHLDFHTSEKIVSVGERFDPEAFARTLKAAHVDSITCFSRCHHGMIYHDTQFEAKHPGLKRDLLREQIEACHAHDIRVPIYITVGWDEFMARRHPEWIEVGPDGKWHGAAPLAPGWRKLCFNSPYIEYVMAQTNEVLDRFPVDGLFFDIIMQRDCCCFRCIESMQERGLDPQNFEERQRFAKGLVDDFRRRMTAEVRKKNPHCTIFYNSGHISPAIRSSLDAFTHLELESLPTGGWGYDHFPMTVRFARLLGVDYLGMTGKFQKSWADFGGFKSQPALEYDCFNALANGAACSVGDQLHPSGELDAATYQLIGAVYAQVEAKEPWCQGAESLAEVAIFTPEAVGNAEGRIDPAARGALRMLLGGHYQFDVIDGEVDFSRYRLIILPDKITLDDALLAKLRRYLKVGGKILASHRSGFGRETDDFVLGELGVAYKGELEYSPDFVVPRTSLANGVLPSQHVMYERGLEVELQDGAEVWADIWAPYFNRAYNHFSSHNQTPVEGPTKHPAVVATGQTVYFAHPIFGMISRHGSPFHRQIVMNALRRLLPDPMLEAKAPSTAQITLTRQAAAGRDIVHILHYIPEKRYEKAETVEEVIPLYNVELSLRREQAPRRVYLAPSGTPLSVDHAAGITRLVVPEVVGHQMVVVED